MSEVPQAQRGVVGVGQSVVSWRVKFSGCSHHLELEYTTGTCVQLYTSQRPHIDNMPGQRGPVPVVQPNGSRDLPHTILETLEHTDPIQTSTTFPDSSQAEIKAAIDRLASRSMVEYDTTDSEIVVLTSEGKQIADEGSHEYKVWKVVKDSGKVSIKELPVR
jgi:hypothetical protein